MQIKRSNKIEFSKYVSLEDIHKMRKHITIKAFTNGELIKCECGCVYYNQDDFLKEHLSSWCHVSYEIGKAYICEQECDCNYIKDYFP
jgi:hypothetical protein